MGWTVGSILFSKGYFHSAAESGNTFRLVLPLFGTHILTDIDFQGNELICWILLPLTVFYMELSSSSFWWHLESHVLEKQAQGTRECWATFHHSATAKEHSVIDPSLWHWYWAAQSGGSSQFYHLWGTHSSTHQPSDAYTHQRPEEPGTLLSCKWGSWSTGHGWCHSNLHPSFLFAEQRS